jgi:hypothetical protein
VLETAFRRSKVEIRGTTFDKCSQIMAYGNDIMGKGLRVVEELLKSLVWQTNKMGLEINGKKSKCMLVEPYNKNEYVNLGTYNFDIVKDYSYLGTVLTNKNELRPETEKELRMQMERNLNFFLY